MEQNPEDEINDDLFYFDPKEDDDKRRAEYSRKEIMGNMAPFSSPDDLKDYLSNGIIERRPDCKKCEPDCWNGDSNYGVAYPWWECYQVNQILAGKFLAVVEAFVARNSDKKSAEITHEIIKECKVLCYDKESQRIFIDKKINELYEGIEKKRSNEIEHEARNSIIFNTPIEIFEQFAKTGKVRAMPGELPGYWEWLTTASSLKAIVKLKLLLQKSERSKSFKEQRRNDNKHSYTWLNNSDRELPELYQKMIAAKLINPDTDQQNFINIFKGQPLTEVTPIRWRGAHNLLAYFIKNLFSYVKEKNNWQIAKDCFTYLNNKLTYAPAENLRQAYGRSVENGLPKKSDIVDELFASFINDKMTTVGLQ
ncbi:MAG TPA: hypothetical protein P5228_05720 [Bacteroidales bacterium]|nr:hypothetical protein [Bacteroidales bacterium]HRZ49234.1 hypothetical protein [Bacteroidales bacterium]